MPHATENGTATMTNGHSNVLPESKFLKHVTSYPVVHDGIENFKSNPYGRKSIDLADSAYQRFAKPVEPYLETPLSYAKPYVEKADALADSGLEQVDARFPIVKEDTSTVIETGKSYIFYPLKVAGEGKDYVLKTWNDEYKKTAQHNQRGPGITTSAMAIISTELKIASDFFHVVAEFIGPKYNETKKKGQDYVRQANDTIQDKLAELQKAGGEKADQAKQEAEKAKAETEKAVSE